MMKVGNHDWGGCCKYRKSTSQSYSCIDGLAKNGFCTKNGNFSGHQQETRNIFISDHFSEPFLPLTVNKTNIFRLCFSSVVKVITIWNIVSESVCFFFTFWLLFKSIDMWGQIQRDFGKNCLSYLWPINVAVLDINTANETKLSFYILQRDSSLKSLICLRRTNLSKFFKNTKPSNASPHE